MDKSIRIWLDLGYNARCQKRSIAMPKFRMRASFSKKCRWCGKAFVPNWSHVRKAWSEYCCKRCGQVGHYESHKQLVHPPFTPDALVELKRLWDGGATCIELMAQYGVGDKYIRRELRRSGVDAKDFRPRGDRGRRPTNARLYRFNAFSNRDADTAYWAGFLMADGSISDSGAISLTSHEQDRGHVVLFARWIGLTEADVHQAKANKYSGPKATVHIGHSRFVSDLGVWGVVPRKSYVFSEPQVSDELFPHFVRGWFDGDGCVSLRKGRERCRITGNRTAMEWLSDQIHSRSGGMISPKVVDRKDGRVWAKLCLNGANNVLKVVRWMRPYVTPCLDRKWLVLKAWAETRGQSLANCKDGRVVRKNRGYGIKLRSH